MKLNEKIHIHGEKVALVPYEKEHVLKYHDWMQDEVLQKLTASEPLSLEEEYSMQKSWREDDNKCTFIVLDKSIYEAGGGMRSQIDSMIGDVNLYLNDPDDPHNAEIEIMIAEPSCRGKGLGKEALLMMINFGYTYLKLAQITAKIGFENETSLRLFHKLSFQEISRAECFQEVTLSLSLTEEVKQSISSFLTNIEYVKL